MTEELHDPWRCFPAGVVSVMVQPEELVTSSRQRAVLYRSRQPRLEADAGCFSGQYGERGRFALYIPSQNRQH